MKKRSFWSPLHVALVAVMISDLLGPFLAKEPVHVVSSAVMAAAVAIAYWFHRHRDKKAVISPGLGAALAILVVGGGIALKYLLPGDLVEPLGMVFATLSVMSDFTVYGENS